MTSPALPVLTDRALNRATLARQLLLERSSLPLATAIGRIGGLQAQEPASPFIGLWSRLHRFEVVDLERAFRDRRVVKATLLRATLHAVRRDDFLRLFPAVQPILHSLTRRDRGTPSAALLAHLAASAADYAAEPRTNVEMRAFIEELVEDLAGTADLSTDDAWWWVLRHVPFVRVPSEVTWSFGRPTTLAVASAWLKGRPFATEEAALEALVRTYLRSFGPATPADAAVWSGVPAGRLRPAIAAIDAAGDLRRFHDERHRILLDLARSPRPDPDVEAPSRFLPMWDSVLLGFADRNRVIGDEERKRVISRNGDTLPTFLVDGRVAGLWWAEAEPDGSRTRSRIALEPFGRLSRAGRRALEVEADRLASFLAPHEPDVYRRYRARRARQPG